MAGPPTRRLDLKDLWCVLREANLRSEDQESNRKPESNRRGGRGFRREPGEKPVLRTASQKHFARFAFQSHGSLSPPSGILPYKLLTFFSLSASSSVSASSLNRHNQFPEVLFGRFMRASVPSPSTSCMGTIAVFATEANKARMKSQ